MQYRSTIKRSGTAIAAATAVGVLAPAVAQAAAVPAPVVTGNLATAARVAPQALKAAVSMSYQVKRGDTVWAIAQRTGTSVPAILSANKLSSQALIYPGQRLIIPGKAGAAASRPAPAAKPAASAQPAATAGTVYVVKAGDTLSAIAKRHGTTVAAIAKANSITNPNRIAVGQRLTIGGTVAARPAPAAKPAAPAQQPLVTNNFPGYTYPDATVAAANSNKRALLAQPVPSPAQVQQKIIATANAMGVNPRLALAHAFVESGFNATAVSPANAIGTMQVIPSSGAWASQLVGRPLNLLNPDDNIVAGIAIIRSLQNSARSMDEGIAGYYQGLGGVQRYGMRSDTVNYVAKVKAAMARF